MVERNRQSISLKISKHNSDLKDYMKIIVWERLRKKTILKKNIK